jgi:hypothetical protein
MRGTIACICAPSKGPGDATEEAAAKKSRRSDV